MVIRPSAEQLWRSEGWRALLLFLVLLAALFPPAARFGVALVIILGVALTELELVIAFNRERIEIDASNVSHRGMFSGAKAWPRAGLRRIVVGRPLQSLLGFTAWRVEFESESGETLFSISPVLWSANDVYIIAAGLDIEVQEGQPGRRRSAAAHALRFGAVALVLLSVVSLAVLLVIAAISFKGA